MKSITTNGQHSFHTELIYVRYGLDGSGVSQLATLHHVHDPLPDDVVYASPLYVLTPSDQHRHNDLDEPYAVSEATCIAKDIQDNCEDENRVLYPVLIESDKPRKLGTKEVINRIVSFIKDELPVSPYECRWYFSGGKSIHVHVPRFVRDSGRRYLKERAMEYDDVLDVAIYSRKRQFRLPGVEHEDSLPKVAIEPEWSGERIIQKATKADPEPPETYADVLYETFGTDVLKNLEQYVWMEEAKSTLDEPAPLLERDSLQSDYHEKRLWKRYRGWPFSPYANAGNGQRSVALVQVKGGLFYQLKRTANLHSDCYYVPCEVEGAIGCDGEYRISGRSPRPVKLSKKDAQKWDFETNDYVVIIGGKSGESKIFKMPLVGLGLPHRKVGELLSSGERQAALAYLQSEGYDIGSAGPNGGRRGVSQGSHSERGHNNARELQRQAEDNGVGVLTEVELLHVANRLLQMKGRDGVHEWFQEQFELDYNRERTNQKIQAIRRKYDDLTDS